MIGRRFGRPASAPPGWATSPACTRELGRLDEAARHGTEAVALLAEIGSPAFEAMARACVGEIDHLRGQLDPGPDGAHPGP